MPSWPIFSFYAQNIERYHVSGCLDSSQFVVFFYTGNQSNFEGLVYWQVQRSLKMGEVFEHHLRAAYLGLIAILRYRGPWLEGTRF